MHARLDRRIQQGTSISGTAANEEDWGLDMTGNWSDFVEKASGSTLLDQDRTHNEVNEITAISETTGTAWIDPVHDRAGNMTTIPKPSSLATGLTGTWDAWNHLVEVKEDATVVAVYEYDGLARRVKKHLDSESPGSPDGIDAYVHTFYNRGWQVLETRRSGSENIGPESLQPEYQYVWSLRYIDAPVLRDENTDTDSTCDDDRIYYLDDANFNVTTLVDTAGDAVERYVYSPYGVLTIYDATWSNTRSDSSYAVEYTHTGRRLDPETGLYYYRHRLYSSQLGRFISRDPVGYQDGGDNTYEYVGGQPSRDRDPTGLVPVVCMCLGSDVSYEKETECAGMGQACCEQACGGASNVVGWRIRGIWGPNWILGLGELCRRIRSSASCKDCCDCESKLRTLIDDANNLHRVNCEDWADDFLREAPRNDDCYKLEYQVWEYRFYRHFPGWWRLRHCTIRVRLCNGDIFYLDNGWWGRHHGGGHLFAPPEIPRTVYPL